MQACIRRWESVPGLLYPVPYGNNDDWFWLYAGVTQGGATLIEEAEHVERQRRMRIHQEESSVPSRSGAAHYATSGTKAGRLAHGRRSGSAPRAIAASAREGILAPGYRGVA